MSVGDLEGDGVVEEGGVEGSGGVCWAWSCSVDFHNKFYRSGTAYIICGAADT